MLHVWCLLLRTKSWRFCKRQVISRPASLLRKRGTSITVTVHKIFMLLPWDLASREKRARSCNTGLVQPKQDKSLQKVLDSWGPEHSFKIPWYLYSIVWFSHLCSYFAHICFLLKWPRGCWRWRSCWEHATIWTSHCEHFAAGPACVAARHLI